MQTYVKNDQENGGLCKFFEFGRSNLLQTNLNERLLKVLQTTSVPQFNSIFEFIKKQAHDEAVGATNPTFPGVSTLLEKADTMHAEMV